MDTARADLHVHTKYSDRPSEWILRRIGTPESFTEPRTVYDRARQRGMKFVTISDHNRIDGALAIAHLPDTFISVEITSYFPEDSAKMHILACSITEAQFQIIQQLRENIYDLRQYFLDEDIVYSVAHPLFRVNDKLSPVHVEKLLVLFNRFEGINGTRDPRAAGLVSTIFKQLTPDMIERMADDHNIEPIGPQPWRKLFTGGSDDHGGVYIASAYTETPPADTVEQFIEHLRRGNHEPGGHSGDSVRLAHSFYHIAHSYYSRKLGGDGARNSSSLIGELFKRLLERPQPKAAGIKGKAYNAAKYFAGRRARKKQSAIERNLVSEFAMLLSAAEEARGPNPQLMLTSEETFDLACRMTHQLSYSFFTDFVEQARRGNLVESLQNMASLGPVAMGISPYLAAMATQHKDERFLQDVATHFEASNGQVLRSDRRAWLSDTLTDVNGVARTIAHLAEVAKRREHELTVVGCTDEQLDVSYDMKNFEPVGKFTTPEYDQQPLYIPPFLEMMSYLEEQRFSELIISTPGPVGMTGLAAGKLLGLKRVGIYHTDFPQYVQLLTEDDALEQITWRFMLWFYDQMDLILVPSNAYRMQLLDGGIDASKMRVLGRGVDLKQFTPDKKDSHYWQRRGLTDGVTFLYVGRVSEEKNIRQLMEDFSVLLKVQPNARLAIVGDGPILGDLRKRYRRPEIAFTGFLEGEDLAQAYASADVFVFPSKTDTFGNVILEAAASGLPAIVTDKGGPAELVDQGQTGLIAKVDEPGAFMHAMREVAADAELRQRLADAARHSASQHGWEASFDVFWQRENANKVTTERATAPSMVRVSQR